MKTWIRVLTSIILLFGVLQAVHAQPIQCQEGLGGRYFSTGSTVEVQIQPAESVFINEIRLFSPGPERVIGTNREVGKVVTLGPFPAGTELVFGIFVRNTRLIFKMGAGSRNPDGEPHARVQCLGGGRAIVGFEDKVQSDDPDFDDAVFQITSRASPSPVIRRPPYDFFSGCNQAEEIEGDRGSHASAIALSQPRQGRVNLNVQASGIVANAFGRAGVGINYDSTFTGTVKILATVRIGPGHDQAMASALLLPPRILVKAGVAGVTSDVFITASPPVDVISTRRFRSALVTPLSGTPINPFFAFEQHVYSPPEAFVIEHTAAVTAGRRLRICAGIQSRARSTAFPGVFALGKAVYSAEITEILIIPQ